MGCVLGKQVWPGNLAETGEQEYAELGIMAVRSSCVQMRTGRLRGNMIYLVGVRSNRVLVRLLNWIKKLLGTRVSV